MGMAAPDAEETIDTAALERLREEMGGDESFLAELIDTYLEDSPQQLAAMAAAVQAGDATSLQRAAHSLKSNSASFGARALAALCQELEAMGKVGTLESAAPRVAQAAAGYEQVRRALQAARPEPQEPQEPQEEASA